MSPADPTGTTLINIGELAKPAVVLIEKISEAVGGIAKPWQTKRVATAEAKADLIRAQTRIEISELEERALRRMVKEEANKQKNIESITEKSIPLLDDNAPSEKVNNDWITNFFDKSKLVSDAEMQQLWASMLAGEANNPGSFSKKTVELVSVLEKSDAELFTKFCGCVWIMGTLVPIVGDLKQFSDNGGIDFISLQHLDSLGLIQFQALAGFAQQGLPETFNVSYYGKTVTLSFPEGVTDLPLGHAVFTKSGTELAKISGSSPSKTFFNYVVNDWAEKGYAPCERIDFHKNSLAVWYSA